MLVVRDEFDRVVSREAVRVDAATVDWVGVGSDGNRLQLGRYTFELESLSAGEVISTRPVEHYAMVAEPRQGPAGIETVLRGGESVLAELVPALRNPANTP